jgi:PhoH-like ATPase
MARPKKVVEAPKDAPETLSEHPFYGFTLDEDQRYFRDNIWDESVRIVFCNARAGSGKTVMAFATANLLYEYGKYDGIIYVVSPYGEGKQGFLPGDITEKSEV